MKICFLPIDNRPVCYNLAKEIIAIDNSLELVIPPRELLGSLTENANLNELLAWLKTLPKMDAIILSLDTIAYGGLIPSRRSTEDFNSIKARLEKLRAILEPMQAKIYAFSSIMRISNNNFNEEEKEYWKDFGKKIFEYSYYSHKNAIEPETHDIPKDILNDYKQTRKRNFEINKLYLDWQKEGFFKKLIFSKDDCAEYGFNVKEAQELEALGGCTKTGADEIPLALLSAAIDKDIKIFVEFTEPEYKHLISNYEDVSIEKSVHSQLTLGGFKIASTKEEADVILIVNNFKNRQGELVMGWETEDYNSELILPDKPFCIADVRFANGADNLFVEQLLAKLDIKNFYGYAGWNTSANTLGSLLAATKVKFYAKKYNREAFNKLQTIRFLDDWAYQANVRKAINEPCDIKTLMTEYETMLEKIFNTKADNAKYSFPWDRKFEVEVSL